MPAPYAPRRIVRQPDWQVNGARFKLYWIDVHGAAAPEPEISAMAEAVAREVLPIEMQAEGAGHDLRFVVLHRGTDGLWLLLDWWAHGDICCQRLFRADPEGGVFLPMLGRPLLACVWELAVIEAERRAWIETMMTPTPNPSAYLATALPDGMH
ncbi:hypothetical protein SAMN05444722_3021 [Rhodovulum sp. ES.010]|uniref:hypothetical protein n=1 Tax=Rhodovulum sp. ES.010 TaxID=1882821 RepID=UPI00092CCAFE|nr:hypothetical protein [Rhodovulum sp. ES.010]SIO52073.1 hypothetical protein SAMN05444722_3021 [Rhodovulum sp. ES.010]